MKKSFNELAKDLAQRIAFLNRMTFGNQVISVYVIPYDNDEWKDEEGIAAYGEKDDHYIVITKNIYKLSNTSEAGLFGTAAHEVRHRFQKKNPNSILSKNFLIENNVLKKNALIKIAHLNKRLPNQILEDELDSMVVEELTRHTCLSLSLEEIIEQKTNEIVSFLTCDEKSFMNLYLRTPKI